jgi:hypothetical protein
MTGGLISTIMVFPNRLRDRPNAIQLLSLPGTALGVRNLADVAIRAFHQVGSASFSAPDEDFFSHNLVASVFPIASLSLEIALLARWRSLRQTLSLADPCVLV